MFIFLADAALSHKVQRSLSQTVFCVHTCALLDQEFQRVWIRTIRSNAHERSTSVNVLCLDLCTSLKQKLDDLQLVLLPGHRQWRSAIFIAGKIEIRSLFHQT